MKIFSILAGAAALVFISDLISRYLFPMMPGSIISILILAALLFSGIVKNDKLMPVSSFFLDNLAFFLIPAVAGTLNLINLTNNNIYMILLLIFITTAIVMTVTGVCSEIIIKVFYKENKEVENG